MQQGNCYEKKFKKERKVTMKRFKKLASFILAAAMVLTMGLTAFADEPRGGYAGNV